MTVMLGCKENIWATGVLEQFLSSDVSLKLGVWNLYVWEGECIV